MGLGFAWLSTLVDQRRWRLWCALLAAPFMMLQTGLASAADAVEPRIVALAHRYIDAQRAFDVATLRAITMDNFIEVSPIGELDDREKMLGFYAPEKKSAAPAYTVEDGVTRVFGDAAIHILTISYTMTVEGKPRSASLRASYVAQKQGADWKLVSAQYTGIRPPKPN